MKRLLLASAALLSTSAMLCSAVQADLGPAGDGIEDKKLPYTVSNTVYDAWCGSKNNTDCKVKFEDGRLIVNDGKGITADQVLDMRQMWMLFFEEAKRKNTGDHGAKCHGAFGGSTRPSCHNHFVIEYMDSSGESRIALIRFRHGTRSNMFYNDLANWSGMTFGKYSERRPSIEKEKQPH